MKKFLRLSILSVCVFTFCKIATAQCWHNGDFITYPQADWGDIPNGTNAASILHDNFHSVYTLGVFEVGISGTGGFSLIFTGANSLIAYLPATGPTNTLDDDLVDPTTSHSGGFGGEVSALKLNVDYSDANVLKGNTGILFGDLIFSGVTSPASINGKTVRQVLEIAQILLGGGSSTFSIVDINQLAIDLNGAFSAGGVSPYAQQHLRKGWKNGDLTTYAQSEWGADAGTTTAPLLLEANFNTVYASNFGVLTVGGGFAMTFDGASAIEDYLPQVGAAGPLDASLSDPHTSASGKFGGDVVTLQLNVDFSDAGYINGSTGLKFGDLVIYNSDVSTLNGITIKQFLVALNTLLGGGTSSYGTINDFQPITFQINNAFLDGTPSAWAQLHLRRGWQNGDLITYVQANWSTGGAASTLLANNYNTVYFSTGGLFVIGSSTGCTSTGYIIQFDDASALQKYLPQSGVPSALTGCLANPTSSSSGQFGGDVAALKLNIDFSDADYLTGNSQLKYGDLTICGLTSNTGLNGMTIRQFLDITNTALGGVSTSYTIADLDAIAANLNASFGSGFNGTPIYTVSTWAQLHLVNGSCDCNNTVTNQCPTATSINVTTTVGTAIKFILHGSDADNNSLTYSINQNPTHGTATIAGGDSIIYTPNAAYHGTDQLKYKVSDGSCEVEATISITIIVCPNGQGYWRNNQSAWPVSSLLLGAINYSKSQLLTILNTPVGTGNKADASLILADQLIAVKLDIANGSPVPAHLADSIAAADALIGATLIPMKVKPNSALGQKMISLATFFANYNSGSMTQGCGQALITKALIEKETLPEMISGLAVKAMPNPSNNNFILTIRSNDLRDQITIEVIDMFGRVIEARHVAGEQTIRLGDRYKAGTYFVKLIQGENHKQVKLVKL